MATTLSRRAVRVIGHRADRSAALRTTFDGRAPPQDVLSWEHEEMADADADR
jgi:hypothetical protein